MVGGTWVPKDVCSETGRLVVDVLGILLLFTHVSVFIPRFWLRCFSFQYTFDLHSLLTPIPLFVCNPCYFLHLYLTGLDMRKITLHIKVTFLFYFLSLQRQSLFSVVYLLLVFIREMLLLLHLLSFLFPLCHLFFMFSHSSSFFLLLLPQNIHILSSIFERTKCCSFMTETIMLYDWLVFVNRLLLPFLLPSSQFCFLAWKVKRNSKRESDFMMSCVYFSFLSVLLEVTWVWFYQLNVSGIWCEKESSLILDLSLSPTLIP